MGFPGWIRAVPNGNHRQELKWETETAIHREKSAAG